MAISDEGDDMRTGKLSDCWAVYVDSTSAVRGTVAAMKNSRHQSQRSWWHVAMPPAAVLLPTLWSVVKLGRIQEASGERLYALFGYSDSAGTGEIFWKEGGQAQAFSTVELPYLVGLSLIIIAAAVGGMGMKRETGWLGLVGFYIYSFICALALSGIFGWLWMNVVGVFI